MYKPQKKCCDTCKYYEWYFDKCQKYNCEVDNRSVCSLHEERKAINMILDFHIRSI